MLRSFKTETPPQRSRQICIILSFCLIAITVEQGMDSSVCTKIILIGIPKKVCLKYICVYPSGSYKHVMSDNFGEVESTNIFSKLKITGTPPFKIRIPFPKHHKIDCKIKYQSRGCPVIVKTVTFVGYLWRQLLCQWLPYSACPKYVALKHRDLLSRGSGKSTFCGPGRYLS